MARRGVYLYGGRPPISNPVPTGSVLRPWYLDLYWRHFHSKGYDALQGVLNTTLSARVQSGSQSLTVGGGVGFRAGECLVLGTGRDVQPVLLTAVVGQSMTVAPKVRPGGFAASSPVTHAWGDDSHPQHANAYNGFAQAIADSRQQDCMGGTNLLGTAGAMETAGAGSVPTGWAAVGGAVCETTVYSASDASPSARTGNGVQVTASAVGDGLRSIGPITVSEGNCVTASAMIKHVSGGRGFHLTLVDSTNPARLIDAAIDPAGDVNGFGAGVFGLQSLQTAIPEGVRNVELRLLATSAGDVAQIDDVRMFHSRLNGSADGYVIGDPGSRSIVYIGDSWGTVTTNVCTYLEPALEARFGRSITFVNAAASGDELWEMVDRFDADVLPHDPAYLIIQHGVNDLNLERPLEDMEADMDEMIALCRGNNIVPVFCGLPPATRVSIDTSNTRNDQMRARVDASL